MDTRDTVRKNIEHALDVGGLRKSALADELGVTRAAVSNWLAGRNSVDIELVPEICAFLGITPNILFGWGDEEMETVSNSFSKLDESGKRTVTDLIEFLRCRR